jgi:hypothetical protein
MMHLYQKTKLKQEKEVVVLLSRVAGEKKILGEIDN